MIKSERWLTNFSLFSQRFLGTMLTNSFFSRIAWQQSALCHKEVGFLPAFCVCKSVILSFPCQLLGTSHVHSATVYLSCYSVGSLEIIWWDYMISGCNIYMWEIEVDSSALECTESSLNSRLSDFVIYYMV